MVDGYYELMVSGDFSSAHSLREYEGNCERVHGHNWKVEVTVTCETLDGRGIAVDFKDLKGLLREVVAFLDHRNLNDIEPFDKINPSSENIARHIYSSFKEGVPEHVSVRKVTVFESDSACASYVPRG